MEWRGRATAMPGLVPLLSAGELRALEQIPAARRPELVLECWAHAEVDAPTFARALLG